MEIIVCCSPTQNPNLCNWIIWNLLRFWTNGKICVSQTQIFLNFSSSCYSFVLNTRQQSTFDLLFVPRVLMQIFDWQNVFLLKGAGFDCSLAQCETQSINQRDNIWHLSGICKSHAWKCTTINTFFSSAVLFFYPSEDLPRPLTVSLMLMLNFP